MTNLHAPILRYKCPQKSTIWQSLNLMMESADEVCKCGYLLVEDRLMWWHWNRLLWWIFCLESVWINYWWPWSNESHSNCHELKKISKIYTVGRTLKLVRIQIWTLPSRPAPITLKLWGKVWWFKSGFLPLVNSSNAIFYYDRIRIRRVLWWW